jgi:hypothetical protein
MVNQYAKTLGFILLVIGVLGFIAPLTPDSKLFGIFLVDPVHNMVHLVSGAVLFAMGFSNNYLLIRRVVLTFAAVYGLVAILGFFMPVVLGMHLNMADNILHLAIVASALYYALPQRRATGP